MSYALRAVCGTCGYESRPPLSLGRPRAIIASCPGCREIVGPLRSFFRFTLPPCNLCGTELSLGDVLDREQVALKETSPVPCPQCHETTLRFEVNLHFLSTPEERDPVTGDEVEGMLQVNGFLQVPDLPLEDVAVHHDIPAETKPGQPLVLRVEHADVRRAIAAGLMARRPLVGSITFRFLRYHDGPILLP